MSSNPWDAIPIHIDCAEIAQGCPCKSATHTQLQLAKLDAAEKTKAKIMTFIKATRLKTIKGGVANDTSGAIENFTDAVEHVANTEGWTISQVSLIEVLRDEEVSHFRVRSSYVAIGVALFSVPPVSGRQV